MKMLIVLLVTLLSTISTTSRAAEISVGGGISYAVTSTVPESSIINLKITQFPKDSSHGSSLQFGSIQRIVELDLMGVELDFPSRAMFVGVDYTYKTKGSFRTQLELGIWVIDRMDPGVDGTLYKFHFGAAVETDIGPWFVQLLFQHLSNGEEIIGTPGPNWPLEYFAFSIGMKL